MECCEDCKFWNKDTAIVGECTRSVDVSKLKYKEMLKVIEKLQIGSTDYVQYRSNILTCKDFSCKLYQKREE